MAFINDYIFIFLFAGKFLYFILISYYEEFNYLSYTGKS